MFESICVWRTNEDGYVNLGELAEALVFYKTVHLALPPEPFKQLVQAAEPEPLLDLMRLGALQVHFVEDLLGVLTAKSTTTGVQGHDFAIVSAEKTTWNFVTREFLRPVSRSSAEKLRLAIAFQRHIKTIRHDVEFTARVRGDLSEQGYLEECISAIILEIAPNYPAAEMKLNLEFDGSLFLPSTNINFERLSAAAGRKVGMADLLAQFYGGRDALEFAAVNSADLGLKPLEQIVAHRKFRRLISRSAGSMSGIDEFYRDVFPQGRCIADVVASGEKTFRDVVRLVEEGSRFKDWLGKLQSDERLLHEYIREVSSVSWAEKLPVKILRWALFTAAGEVAASHIGAASLGLIDALLLDRILKGWRPNEFVQGPLKEFTGAERR